MQKSLFNTLSPRFSNLNNNPVLDEDKDAYHQRLMRVMNDKGQEDFVYNQRKISARSSRRSNSFSRRSIREYRSPRMVPGEVQNNGIGLIITPFVQQNKKFAWQSNIQSPRQLNSY